MGPAGKVSAMFALCASLVLSYPVLGDESLLSQELEESLLEESSPELQIASMAAVQASAAALAMTSPIAPSSSSAARTEARPSARSRN